MFLRPTTRHKDGKLHRFWSVVENCRVRGRRFVQKTLLYLGAISDSEHAVWCRTIDKLKGEDRLVQLSLFPQDRQPSPALPAIQVYMDRLELSRPRQWGACWLALRLWEELALDDFWRERLAPSREGTSWLNVLKTLVAYRLIDPGSEWRLHRLWFDHSAMADLLGEDFRHRPEGHALPLSGQAGRAQGRFVFALAPTLGVALRRPLRDLALRPDQHLFRE